MNKLVSTFLITSAFAASFVFAQATHTPPSPEAMAQRRVNRLTKLLTLTTAQQQQALTIFTNASSTDATTHASLKTARQSLATAMQANDTGTIQTLSTQIGSLTSALVQSEASANAAFLQILTPAQQTLYNNLHEAGVGGFGHRGGRS